MPASPDDVVQPDLILPPQSDPFEAIPFGRRQLLSGTNSNALMSYGYGILFLFITFFNACQSRWEWKAIDETVALIAFYAVESLTETPPIHVHTFLSFVLSRPREIP